jgi:hypothetical protein
MEAIESLLNLSLVELKLCIQQKKTALGLNSISSMKRRDLIQMIIALDKLEQILKESPFFKDSRVTKLGARNIDIKEVLAGEFEIAVPKKPKRRPRNVKELVRNIYNDADSESDTAQNEIIIPSLDSD